MCDSHRVVAELTRWGFPFTWLTTEMLCLCRPGSGHTRVIICDHTQCSHCSLSMHSAMLSTPLPLSQIVVSKKWGFTKWPRSDYKAMREKGTLQPDGVGVQYKPEHGPLRHWEDRQE